LNLGGRWETPPLMLQCSFPTQFGSVKIVLSKYLINYFDHDLSGTDNSWIAALRNGLVIVFVTKISQA
jgi:hypothetical protein